jgi:hypothetical protein
VVDDADHAAGRERRIQREQQRVPIHRAPVDLRVVPIGVVVHHRHQHGVEAARRQRDAVVRNEQLLGIRQPVAAVAPLEVLRRERRACARMIVRDHVAIRSHDARKELRVPARGRVHVEHAHAGRDAEKREDLGGLAVPVAIAVGRRALGMAHGRVDRLAIHGDELRRHGNRGEGDPGREERGKDRRSARADPRREADQAKALPNSTSKRLHAFSAASLS